MSRPLAWLGAYSPGRLALPDAKPTRSQMYAPRGVWLDAGRLIVCDSGNHRILIWNAIPSEDREPADIVLGQATFEDEGPAAHGRGPGNGFHLPTGVIVVDGKLIVADPWHHRVLVWNAVPDRSDVPPDYAIGQNSLSDVERNRGRAVGRDTLYWPYGVGWVAGRLHVADTGNRRVLIWDGLPSRDEPADVVLGQPDEHSADENRGGPVSHASFRWPHAIAGTGDLLWVSDAGNHRVLGWNGRPDGDRAADWVLGQKDFSSAWEMPHGGQGSSRLRFPYSITLCNNGPVGCSAGSDSGKDGCLAVADTANNRVLFWEMPPASRHGAPAEAVIGQIDFAGNGENRWDAVLHDTLCWPYGICMHDGLLAVADSGNNRVMLWDCRKG